MNHKIFDELIYCIIHNIINNNLQQFFEHAKVYNEKKMAKKKKQNHNLYSIDFCSPFVIFLRLLLKYMYFFLFTIEDNIFHKNSTFHLQSNIAELFKDGGKLVINIFIR